MPSRTPAKRKRRTRAPSVSAVSTEQLQQTLEELQVAEEELRQQNDELRAARTAVEAERQRYQDLFEFAPDTYLVTNVRGTIQEANAAAATLLSVPPEFLVGKPLAIYVSRSAGRKFRLQLPQLADLIQPQVWETRFHPRTGGEFDAELTVAPIRDGSGKTTGLRWLIRDITARKQAEEQIRRLNAELEQRVQERTIQLEDANRALTLEIAEREQSEGAVLASNQRINAILNSITDSYIALNHEWLLIDLNPAAEQILFGRPRAELIGKVLWDEYPRARETEFYRQYHRAVAEQRPIHFEAKSAISDEWFETHAYPAGDGLHVYFRDITERKHAEEVQSRLAAIVASSDDAIMGLTLNGEIESWNPGAERLFGYTAAEAKGRPVSIIYPPELPEEFPAIVGRLQHGERIDHYETERVRKDGARLFVSVSISPIRDADGQLIGAAKIARDVTQQRRKREAERFMAEASVVLASSLAYETTLQTVAQLAVPFLGDYCTINVVEEGAAPRRVALVARAPAQAELLRELLEHPDSHKAENYTRQVLDSGQPLMVQELPEDWYTSVRDTRLAEILDTLQIKSYMIVPLMVRGRAVGTISLGCLESNRRYDDQDLTVAQDLARRAAYAVDNARLYHESQAALIARDQFLSVASHEVRTPLTVIQGYTQLLKRQLDETPDTPGAQVVYDRARLVRTLQNIDYSAERLVTLVGDLLDISRMRDRGLSVTPEQVELKQLLLKVIENVRSEKQYHENKRDIRFEVQLPESEVRGEWDPARLEQVLVNLIDNALKYSPARGASIYVQLDIEPPSEDNGASPVAHLSVQDEGIGIPPGELGKMFQPFIRASNATARHFPGLGLGLAVTREIVMRHGGKIWVESPGPDQGTTFHVVLPGVQ